jgi:diguanylate cyclase (GGDEF)-like protein
MTSSSVKVSSNHLEALVGLVLRRGRPDALPGDPRIEAAIRAMPAPTVTEPCLRADVNDVVPPPPLTVPKWASAYAMLTITDPQGITLTVGGHPSTQHLILCVFSDAPHDWHAQDVEALRIVGSAAADEVRLRAELAEQARITEGVRHYRLRDPLTDAANRAVLLDRLTHATMRWARSPEQSFGVLSVGIDQIADIESTLGYEAADDVVTTVAQRLGTTVRAVDTVAHTGGDEFIILLESMAGQQDAAAVAERVREVFRAPVTTSWSDPVMVSASVGIAMITSDVDSAPRLMQQATMARTRARTKGTGIEFFDAGMQELAQKRLWLETDLRQAVEADEFELYYQPIISLATGRITQLEALVRWRHPGRGLMTPGDFIPLAEETGVIVPIGWWVLAHGCPQLCEWRHRFSSARGLTMTVNVAAHQLAQPDLVERVEQMLSASGLEPGAVHLEIKEGALTNGAAEARATLERLRRVGIGVELDDFGTGYSSLWSLHELPLDAVKIDRSIVARLRDGERHLPMIATIRELAGRIGVAVVAEGVESAEQLQLVRSIGCDRAQGYFIAEPLPVEEIEILLEESRTW